jgi:hypothetical protein
MSLFPDGGDGTATVGETSETKAKSPGILASLFSKD